MSKITLKVNGTSHTVDVEASTPLLYVLRNDLDLHGPRFGCGLGQCGACTVLINGAAARSCVLPVGSVRSEVTTLEGLAKGDTLHPVQQAWMELDVPQCGYCQSGQVMTVTAMLQKNAKPSDADIDEVMRHNICRCGTYQDIRAAIHRAAEIQAKGVKA